MRAVGLGCHTDRIYLDLRPLIPGFERVYVMVWNTDEQSDATDYCDDVIKLQTDMIQGRFFKRALIYEILGKVFSLTSWHYYLWASLLDNFLF